MKEKIYVDGGSGKGYEIKKEDGKEYVIDFICKYFFIRKDNNKVVFDNGVTGIIVKE